ncbi:MAG: hypothetical protein FJY86_03110 [Candidatus Diapherotrites archaeon]|uniref:Uncharacterized protein n=1 Tax=Candidatus Iainarchaeum sp. TaxID=3101447 RepID=A0A8T4C742_9ARCH|nr:hypothetical protein [Candidatus Diapherotrites archaeon]
MSKGFFLVFEFLVALLLFSAVYVSVLSTSSSDHFSNNSRELAILTCVDFLHLWLLGEEDISSLASELDYFSFISFSSTPFTASTTNDSSSYVCSASRWHRGVNETLFIRLEW